MQAKVCTVAHLSNTQGGRRAIAPEAGSRLEIICQQENSSAGRMVFQAKNIDSKNDECSTEYAIKQFRARTAGKPGFEAAGKQYIKTMRGYCAACECQCENKELFQH